ncbi:protocadherin Fat 4-like isoform X2 [Crassostrea angulata]|uniref:protocadherin Fat 4-like isoform X2 n=1 Tax=Magallana angulata TaxID=2784310 RepID=UPI0022B139B7|nr:protocadherin Fat 4-like isoform X2 [Crassostrea angulata]XP_052700901.1 protocadherin Fat 4-like isoform X2 [Crassostrea angulata]XP_052700909.1 protocadherin Fat 4-like isoform X2 [Crassostrea angulata]
MLVIYPTIVETIAAPDTARKATAHVCLPRTAWTGLVDVSIAITTTIRRVFQFQVPFSNTRLWLWAVLNLTGLFYYHRKIQIIQLRAIVGVVPATDPDTVGVLNYSITDEGGDSRFLIGSFGEVSMVNTRRGGNAIVTVTDGVFYVNASVKVNVVSGETNDTHEHFNVSNCSIFENKDKGTSFCSVFKEGYVDYTFDPLSDRTKFNLNSTTGNITTNAPLDREDIDHYDYSVIAIQSKNPCKFATIPVKISVLDENDETPMFDQPVYRGKIRENANGTKVTLETPLKVTDRDLNSTFIFNISGTAFTISSTGEIFTSDETIDRETHSSYSLTVMVSDEKHETFSIVEISVEDMNDNPPMASNMTFSVFENATEDTDIGQVFATDADIGINAQLIFTDASSGYFEVNITGFLKVNRLLDRETKDKDVFTVSVCDSGRDISLCIMPWITVNILDVNEAPIFKYNKEVPVYHIPENSNCSSISDLTEFFVDGDLGVNRELDFSVLSESDTFHIDSKGKLSCPDLDYDDSLNKVYALTIQATDRGDPPLSTNGTIIIVVEDVNDNAPIPSDETNFEIVFYSGRCENCSKLVALITATDKDSGSNGEIEFQEIRGNASTFLEIDSSTGLIEAPTNDMSLSNGTYLYIVNITDKGTPSRGTTVTLSFNVAVLMNTQISRVFDKDKLIFNWTENVAFPSPFIPVKNFTKNFTINPAMSIEKFVLPNYNLGDFYLNGSEQEFLYVNRTKHSTFFDRETQQQYRFIIQAKLPLYSMLAELTITIIDVNDNPPRFQSDIAQVAVIKENATNGTSLDLTFVATDRDEGENAQIAYKISNDNCDNVFQLNNSDSGNIVLIGKLDYEDKEYCNLTLTVFNPNNETMQSSVDVHIEIVDVNDNSPLFDQSVYHVSINERVKDLAEEEVLVYINGLSVTDPDSRQFGKKSVRISIERPSECPLLVREHKVDNFVLMINQSMTLDYESTINFNCTLRATDGGNLSSTALLEIELLDINDNSPEADDVIEREIPRSSEIDYVIVSQINATDRDSGRNALLSFDFSTNDDGYSYFKIDATNGKISIAKNLTTLQLDSVELTVIVSDDGLPQPLSTSVMVMIIITDDNERPFFSQAEYRKGVEENTKLEGVLMTVTAQDRKKENITACNCTYRLIDISDNSNDFYTIDGVTGDLIVNVSGYDREEEPFITLTVVARDEGGKETSARVNITVLDQNDNDPKFLEDFQFEVYQEAPVGTCFGMVTAEDKDEGMNAVTLYKIIRDSNTSSNYNDSVIVIKETTGELCSNESLNIGAVRDFTEHVRVEAIDKGDRNRRNRVTVSVIIKYKDTNQHHPTIIQVEQGDIEPISLKSRQTNIPVTTLSANDPDEGKDGEVEFSILEGNVLDMFTIDRDTGDLSFSSKITMIGSHPVYLTVQATDKGVHPKSSTLTLNLTLEGEKESYIADKVKSAEEFMTYTWSLVGVACFLILVTAAAVFGFCQSRIKAHRDSELDDDFRRTLNGLKHNVSYGFNMPQMHMFQQDRTDTNAQRRTRLRSDSTSFESSQDRYPPERDVPEEFDQRRSFRISLFDPSPERHASAPQLPPPRESSGPLIPKPDYN